MNMSADAAHKSRERIIRRVYYVVLTLLIAFPIVVISVPGGFFICAYCRDAKNTLYSSEYSKKAFSTVRIGMKSSEVQELLGPPLQRQQWDSAPRWVHFGNGGSALMTGEAQIKVSRDIDSALVRKLASNTLSYDDFQRICGGVESASPVSIASWYYSRPRSYDDYSYMKKEIIVDLDAAEVVEKVTDWVWD